MLAFVLAAFTIAAPPADQSISPEAAEALRAASKAAGALESKATSGSPDVRAAVLSRIHRLQEEAGLWSDAAATSEQMATSATGSYGRAIWAKSLARAGAIDKATEIADSLKGQLRD